MLILAYKETSKSAKQLAEALGISLFPSKKLLIIDRPEIIINWGCSNLHVFSSYPIQIINHPEAVEVATNKLHTFQELERNQVRIPSFTKDVDEATKWLSEGSVIVGRELLRSKGGHGILIFNPKQNDQISECKLYTKHVRHKYEFRVHVFDGKVIDFTQKKRRKEHEADTFVRTYANNWVFARQNVVLPDDVAEQAIKAVRAIGLDFGAVDVGYVASQDKAYVFEVNTAPGIEGTTLQRYVEVFTEL